MSPPRPSPFLQRFRRHQNLATSMRAGLLRNYSRVESTAATQEPGRTEVHPARLLPPDSTLPVGYLTGLPLPTAAPLGVPARPAIPGQAQATPPTLPTGPADRLEIHEESPQESMADSAGDSLWDRLQSIFERHQDKAGGRPEPSLPAPAGTPRPLQPGPGPAPDDGPKKGGHPAGAKAQASRAQSPPAAGEDPPLIESGSESELERPGQAPKADLYAAETLPGSSSIPAPAELPERSAEEPHDTETAAAGQASGARPVARQHSLQDGEKPAPGAETVQSDLHKPDQIAEGGTRHLARQPGPEHAPGRQADEPFDSSVPPAGQESQDSQPQQQGLPLEQAWPVERRPAQEPEAGFSPTPQEDASLLSPAPDPAQHVSRKAEDPYHALGHVRAAHPSDSSIDLVPPRRPRPVPRRPEPGRIAPAAPGRKREPVSRSRTVDKMPHPADQDAVPLVESELGPLPEDLWELLDEPLPSWTQLPGEETIPARQPAEATGPVDKTTVQQAAEDAASPFREAPVLGDHLPEPEEAEPETPASPELKAGILQRSAREGSPATRAEEATQQTRQADIAVEPAETRIPAEEIDLDALALQVYRQLRRRLQVDWERRRS